MRVYYDRDADVNLILGKKVAIVDDRVHQDDQPQEAAGGPALARRAHPADSHAQGTSLFR